MSITTVMSCVNKRDMLKTILYIGIGSGIGGVARYLLSRVIQEHAGGAAFPWGTFVVNITGCLLIGIIYGALDRGFTLSPETKAFLTVGLCGGFTTFSTFVHENYLLFDSGEFPTVAIYAGISFSVGLLLAYAGHWLAKAI